MTFPSSLTIIKLTVSRTFGGHKQITLQRMSHPPRDPSVFKWSMYYQLIFKQLIDHFAGIKTIIRDRK